MSAIVRLACATSGASAGWSARTMAGRALLRQRQLRIAKGFSSIGFHERDDRKRRGSDTCPPKESTIDSIAISFACVRRTSSSSNARLIIRMTRF